ncbi:adenosylmethionine decarboxylase [Saccharomycopsis crataegensis]|uniref:adenosylmethionine decarboxylase n=1 Tax=Saccharomycopsis crataegensis TaxID=43959 RepID=A0AAV5QH40_9ASCO|nr:adenosylmethionine decarboxylase [Saccharomycopsis crataegensis]
MAPSISYQCEYSSINHKNVENLDSTDAFEGPEKLLEIWLSPIENLPNNGFRCIPLNQVESLLDDINCKILSQISSDNMDAYLLSESSLFVFNNKIILKTCGTTTTLLCIEKLFKLVKEYLQWDLTKFPAFKVFYSRRSFMFPQKQVELHQNWNNEVEYLDKYFPGGDSYIVGKSNKDHWHLFTSGVGFINANNLPVNSIIASDVAKKKLISEFKDETFEILMTRLSDEVTTVFNTQKFLSKCGIETVNGEFDGHKIGEITFKESGLAHLYEIEGSHDIKSNCFSFNPCGFSSNSIVDNSSYYTLHITPESGWSYASFETNVNPYELNTNNLEVLKKILKIFQPGCFCFTIFELKDEFNSRLGMSGKQDDTNNSFKLLKNVELKGYKRVEKIMYDIDEYKLLYVNFVKI